MLCLTSRLAGEEIAGNLSNLYSFFLSQRRGKLSNLYSFSQSQRRGNLSNWHSFFESQRRGDLSNLYSFFQSQRRGNLSNLHSFFDSQRRENLSSLQSSSMADDQRVYPAAASSDGNASVAAREKAPRSYIVQLPKDQVYRSAAPPQRRYAPSPPPRRRRNPCCCCLAWIFCPLILLIVLIAIAAGVFYIVFRPQIPKYSLNGISVQRFNISQDLRLSSDLIVTVRSQNSNKKIGIFYDDGNRLAVLYSGRVISSGVIPAFYQAPRKTTLVRIKMTASRVPFSAALKSALDTDQTKGSVPLYVEMNEPVRLKFGSLKTPKVTIQLRCKLTVNQLTAKRKVRIQQQSCSIRIKL